MSWDIYLHNRHSNNFHTNPYFIPYTKINLKWMIELSIKGKTKSSQNTRDPEVGTQNAQTIK